MEPDEVFEIDDCVTTSKQESGRVFSKMQDPKDPMHKLYGIKLGKRGTLYTVRGNPKGQIEKDITNACKRTVPPEVAGKRRKTHKTKRRKSFRKSRRI